jgi:hypothetical protein
MPKKILAKTEKSATKKVVVRKNRKSNIPESLRVDKKSVVKKRIIRKKIVSQAHFADNISNYFKIRPLSDFQEEVAVATVPHRLPRRFIKITVMFLVVALNWMGLSAINITAAYFNDTETSQNFFQASSLDFSLAGDNFSPAVTPSQNAISTINLQNDGLMGFVYGVKVQSASGTLCDFLELKDSLSDIYQPLNSFVSATTTFTAIDSMVFDTRLTNDSKALQNKACELNFVFDGEQNQGAGFNDSEGISRTIIADEWPGVIINKVYYNVDFGHGRDSANEWIELYNPTESPIDISSWIIADNTGQDVLASSSPLIIPGLDFAIIAAASTTWNYWEIPADVLKIQLDSLIGGHGLHNDADMLVLKDNYGNIVDQMNWGISDHSWANYAAYSAGVWEPGVAGVDKGHLLARLPSGLDTDAVSDWQDLTLPEIALLYPIGGEKWYVGQAYDLRWTASSTNDSLDSDLKIDLYYSNNSGKSWAVIATSTENDGIYNWRVPLFLDYGHYYIPSPIARIKVVATGPENFMVQAASSSKDFCPPIDYDALSLEEQQLVDQLVNEGLIDESEVIRGGVAEEDILSGMESDHEQEISAGSVPESGEIIVETIDTVIESLDTENEVVIIENESDQNITVEIISEDAIEATEPATAVTEQTAEAAPEDSVDTAENLATETSAEEITATDPLVNQEILNIDEPAIESEPPADFLLEDMAEQAMASPELIVEASPQLVAALEPSLVLEPASVSADTGIVE